jgi:ATP synthase, subunit E
MLNNNRLKLLKAKEEHIKNVLEEARHKLNEVTKDNMLYTSILQKLIAQVNLITINKHTIEVLA